MFNIFWLGTSLQSQHNMTSHGVDRNVLRRDALITDENSCGDVTFLCGYK